MRWWWALYTINVGACYGYPGCCVLAYGWDIFRDRPPCKHREEQFGVKKCTFWKIGYVPCRLCATTFLGGDQ